MRYRVVYGNKQQCHHFVEAGSPVEVVLFFKESYPHITIASITEEPLPPKKRGGRKPAIKTGKKRVNKKIIPIEDEPLELPEIEPEEEPETDFANYEEAFED